MKHVNCRLLRFVYALSAVCLFNLIVFHHFVQKDVGASISINQEINETKDKFKLSHSKKKIKSNSELKPRPFSIEKVSKTALLDYEAAGKRHPGVSDGVLLKEYNVELYQRKVDKALTPVKDESTAWLYQRFWSGFCNQYMMFIGVMYILQEKKHNQFIEDSLQWKDTYGTEHYISHRNLFDAVHWNSFYPDLPRFARYEKDLHPDISVTVPEFKMNGKKYPKGAWLKHPRAEGFEVFEVSVNPKPIVYKPKEMISTYKNIMKSVTLDRSGDRKKDLSELDKTHRLIMSGALKPHPEIQSMIDLYLDRMKEDANRRNDANSGKDEGFMVLHARVEFDMAMHPVCKDKKVTNMTDILSMIYQHYPEPPVSTVLIIFNRELMESTADTAPNGIKYNKDSKSAYTDPVIRKLTEHNLMVINGLVQNGMWGGAVQVREAGSKMVKEVVKNPYYAHYSTIVGAIVNFFIAIQSDIFIGTEVSTYSTLVTNSRFYRGSRDNFFYKPQGLELAIPPDSLSPHRFSC